MDIIVCLKQTFDTESRIVIADGKISEEGVQFIVNPYDEYAVEEAVKIRDESGGTVTIVAVGPARVEEAVRTALAMGADDAVIVDAGGAELDELVVSEALAAVVRRRSFDLILAGNQAVDDGSSQVAVRVATLLGIAHIGTVTKLSVEGKRVTAERDAEGNVETVEGTLPLLATAQQGLNEPRYPSLIGIRKAAKKPVEHYALDSLGLPPEALRPKAVTVSVALPPSKGGGRILQGDTPTRAGELVRELRETNRVV